ncbi:uncharacterized protein IL334_007207 [Kwoniella shivajii]|uniref:Golgi apparatus membrane protein TVP38 n=1 Tax=Kwoniella shivajii TaxID=564305 RepID=A0ABZ1DC10_9TREE|nr:hypothetical protein IL334_007207 [Kwoniella shivajii]
MSSSSTSASTPHTSSSPPSYSSPSLSSENINHKDYPIHPSLEQRKSSTIITFTPTAESEPDLEPNPHQIRREDEGDGELEAYSAIPPHMRSNSDSNPMSRINSDTSIHSTLSQLEEGEMYTTTGNNTITVTHPTSQGENDDQPNETTSLLGNTNGINGNGPGGKKKKWYKGPYAITAIKFSILFTIFTIIVVGTFYFGLPKLDSEDKKVIKLPRNFQDLQELNALFQKYKTRYPFRILACAVVTYLFVQTFTLPGSMYISIIFGAAYGIMYGLVLSCFCDATGSLLCYTLSSLLAPPLLTMPFYRARVETWRTKIMGDPKKGKKVTWDSVFAFLLVLRIAPFPPHWVANFVAPHLGIGRFMFWCSCFIGIAPVSVIHVTIGSSLDSMTSAADFHLLSLRNILGLLAVVVAVLIPVGLKRVFKKDLGDLGEAEEVFVETSRDERQVDVPPVGGMVEGRRYHAIDSGVVLSLPSRGDGTNMGNKLIKKGKGKNTLEIIPDQDEDGDEDGDGDDDQYDEDDFDFEDDSRFEDHSRYQGESQGETSHSNSTSNADSRSSRSGDNSPSTPNWENQYQIYDPSGQINRVEFNHNHNYNQNNNNNKPYRPNTSKGYGSIQPIIPEPRERVMPSMGGWWPFTRGDVA